MAQSDTSAAVRDTILLVCGAPSCGGKRPKQVASGAAPEDCPGARLVALQDKPPVCDALLRMVNAERYHVIQVFSMAEAMQASKLNPKLVITDAKLADGDGFDLCRSLAIRKTRRVPVLILSAADTNKDGRQKAAQAGAFGFFRFPVVPELLENAVTNILGAGRN